MKSLSDLQSEYLADAYRWVIPEVVLVGTACLLFLLAVAYPRRIPAFVLALAGLIGAMAAAVVFGPHEVARFWGAVEGTPFDPRSVAPIDPTGTAPFLRWLAIGAGVVFLLPATSEVSDDSACEYYGCLLVIVAGTSLVGRANDLVSLFLALEMVSIPTYVLLYLPARTKAGQEAAAKYFLLSVLSSAVFLFGLSYFYGLTGTTNLGAAIDCLTSAKVAVNPLALVAVVMVIAGLGFRITAFPFHFYAPDVYEGGPTGVIAQVSFIPKVIGFVALARLLGMMNPAAREFPFDAQATLIPLVLWLLAAATMTFGNVMALLQTNLKRLMAYSGIAHGGYMLVAVVVACSLPDAMRADVNADPVQAGLESLWFYLVAYGLMTVGVFAVLAALSPAVITIDDLTGLGQSRPVTAVALVVLLFSLIGLPPTAGFLGKLLILLSAFDAPTVAPMHNMYRILAIILAVNAAVGAVYYLRIIGVMYLRSPLHTGSTGVSRTALAAGLFCALATIVLGIYPTPLLNVLKQAGPPHDDRPPAFRS